ncbi:MAG TPA: hypothetical protein VIG51_00360 [Candidatus Baltobacteraceae bacterium]|jgi:hypothetical protein
MVTRERVDCVLLAMSALPFETAADAAIPDASELLDLTMGQESYADLLARGFLRMAMFRVAVDDRFPARSSGELWDLLNRERAGAISGELRIGGAPAPWPADLQARRTIIFNETAELRDAIAARCIEAMKRIGAPW